ncbi:HNH endonuclease [Neptunicella sp.]|uniref:HNH endonuclease n=1 Tax=Neptunicella sp. TaxID=2125986 RepID=UPI003F690A8C
MPIKAARQCRECKRATTNDNGFCDKHQDKSIGWNVRLSAWKGKGSTRAWRRIREQILARDNWMCVSCSARGIYQPANQVDHLVPKTAGGTDHPNNLQSLCDDCHEDKTISESHARGGTKTQA